MAAGWTTVMPEFANFAVTNAHHHPMKLANKDNILQLAALLKAHGITTAVLCPGSRNAPLVQTFAASGFDCHAVTDERSAGFYAIGLSIAGGRPVAVCCTSGSALANLYPAVTEAYYQQVPLVVVSADRPAAWIGQMDGQTMPQPGIFGSMVRMSAALPEVKDEEDEWLCNRLINEALLAAVHHGCGPVHINVPVGEPLFDFTASELPAARVIRRFVRPGGDADARGRLLGAMRGCRRVMLVIGQSGQPVTLPAATARRLCSRVAVMSEHPGNCRPPLAACTAFDAALCAMDEGTQSALAPDLLLTCGGHITSKRFKIYIRRHRPLHHWHISDDGRIADLFMSQTAAIEDDAATFLAMIADALDDADTAYPAAWMQHCSSVARPRFGYSAMSATGSLVRRLPAGSTLHLANSSAIRYAQLYPVAEGVTVRSNRGMNGIEGSLSAAIGHAAADPSRLNFIIIGDLSFFYDMNSLALAGGMGNVRILLINNGGGEIFSTLKGLDKANEGFDYITATHRRTAEGWAASAGFDYTRATDAASLDIALTRLADPSAGDRPVLVEAMTDTADDVSQLKDYYRSLKTNDIYGKERMENDKGV